MNLRRHLTRDDPGEHAESVAALHAAMTRVSEDGGLPESLRVFYEQLSRSRLWLPDPRGGMSLYRKQAADGTVLVTAATTRARIRKVVGRFGPGPLVEVSVRALAFLLDEEGIDSLVINPGSLPTASLARPLIRSLADGVVPDPFRPETLARAAGVGVLEIVQEAELSPELLVAARAAVGDEVGIEAASIGQRPMGPGFGVYVVFAVLAPGADREAIASRVTTRIRPHVGHGKAVTLQATAADDVRLHGGSWTEELIPGQ